ncbi:zeta-sarcoglycan-like isoform X4 [Notolabrus celidotus]|uniref:zeta-sarcoglycan-like isoform X4 n=1 Tax=Notolabrus celidotus TaxID=1203425 RepID=UPI00149002A3|nr:zeta-sarcoglycan-like isoform X4 [Notolabrus celidotus]
MLHIPYLLCVNPAGPDCLSETSDWASVFLQQKIPVLPVLSCLSKLTGRLIDRLFCVLFLLTLRASSVQDSMLVFQSEKNVTLNVRNEQGHLTGQLTVGPEAVEAQCKGLEVRSKDGERLLFTANEEEVIMTTEKFTVTGSEGAVFGHSVETPLIQARASEDLKLESPTRTLTMEAPRGVEVSAAMGPLKVSGRKDLQLESTEGEILLDANTIQLGSLPLGVYTALPHQVSQEQEVYEVCVCPSGKIYLSPAESSSTCQAMSNICLWS